MDRITQIQQRLTNYQYKSIDQSMPEAGILVPVTREEDPKIVLTRRSQHLNTHQGQVAFPGGKFDQEDKNLLTTALRECHEEIGIPPSEVDVLGPLSQVVSLHGLKVSPYVGLIEADTPLVANQDELDSIFKVPVSFLLSAEPSRRDRMTYKGLALSVPSYDYEYQGETYEIWGLSAIVLVELLNLAYDAGITIFDEARREVLQDSES